MPTNKKEGIIFTTLMCFSMVLGMSIYNLLLHGSFSFVALITGLIPGFIVAFILDVFVIGVLAKKIAFSLPLNKDNKLVMILTISCLMILGMVTCMSLFGVLIEGGMPNDLGGPYRHDWSMNIIDALPHQLIVVGPFSRAILGKIQANAATAETAE